MAEPTSVHELRPGDHACLTFSDPDERLDIVAAFVDDGLRTGQRVHCYTDSLAPRVLVTELTGRGLAVEESLRQGRLRVASCAETYLASGSFEAGRMLDVLAQDIDRAHRDGYSGLRITGDMCWALRPVAGVEQLVEYESEVGRLLAAGRAMAICQYDRECFDPVTLASVAATHNSAVAAVTYHDDAVLRICRQHVPSGIRVAGELDFRFVDAFARAMAEAVRLDEHIHVNLAQLRFLDAAAAGVIVQATASLTAERQVTVRCQPLPGKVLRTLGADQIQNLRLVVHDVDF